MATIIGNYFEMLQFDIANLGPRDVVLGSPWLRKYNPTINWKTYEIEFDGCRYVEMARDKRRTIQFRESSPGQAGTPRDMYEEEPKYSTRPLGGRAKHTIVNIDAFVTEEIPMTDDEIETYVVVDYVEDTKTLCRIEEEV